jgi:hypothetical protein
MKFVKLEPEGAGKCPDEWSLKRLEYKKCAMKRCKLPPPEMKSGVVVQHPIPCNKSIDVVMLIDGSGSLGKKGWAAEVQAARYMADAFEQSGKGNIAIILYSGPRTWGGVKKCTGKNKKPASMAKCGIKLVTHFTHDIPKVKKLINEMKWPKGSTLTSLALLTAKSEMALGRRKSKANVIVFTDGRPLSFRKTFMASREVRKAARLVWVPVTKNAPLKQIKRWATRRWQENVVPVKSFKQLASVNTVTHIIADICPKKWPRLRFGRQDGMILD